MLKDNSPELSPLWVTFPNHCKSVFLVYADSLLPTFLESCLFDWLFFTSEKLLVVSLTYSCLMHLVWPPWGQGLLSNYHIPIKYVLYCLANKQDVIAERRKGKRKRKEGEGIDNQRMSQEYKWRLLWVEVSRRSLWRRWDLSWTLKGKIHM